MTDGISAVRKTMKKLMLVIGLLCAVCTWTNAEITEAKIQDSKDRVEKIKEVKNNLAGVSTGNGQVDAFKDKAVEVCEEVIKSGEKMAELYTAMNANQNVLKEAVELSLQLAEEGTRAAELGKMAEPAGKEMKNIKNPKTLLSAKKIISNATDAATLSIKEIAFQVQLINEMVEILKAKQ